MIGYWFQGFIVGLLLYGIVLFLFGVRNKNDFIQLTARFNKRKSAVKGILLFVIPPLLAGFVWKFIMNRSEWFFRWQTLLYAAVAALAIVLIILIRRIEWKSIYLETRNRLRFSITPLQVFIFLTLLVFSIFLVWFLVGEFWIFSNTVVWIMLIVYLQLLIVYWFGNMITDAVNDKMAEQQGKKYIRPRYLRITQYHIVLFLSLTVLVIFGVWYFIGPFLFFSNIVVYTIIGFYGTFLFFYLFGHYLVRAAETSEELREILQWSKTHKLDLVYGAFVASVAVLWFIFQDSFMEWWVGGTRIWTSTVAGLATGAYLFVKIAKRGNVWEKIIDSLGIHKLKTQSSELDRVSKQYRKKIVFTYLKFFIKLIVLAIVIGLIYYYWDGMTPYLPSDLVQYQLAISIVLTIFIVWGTGGSLISQLAFLRSDETSLYRYEKRKRILLMIELEELKKEVQKEKERLDDIRSENIQAAINLLKKNGYQIVIGPETKLYSGESTKK